MEEIENYKIWIKNKAEDKEIQKILLSCGLKWAYDKRTDMRKSAIFIYLNEQDAFEDKAGVFSCSLKDKPTEIYNKQYYRDHKNKEITLKELRDKDFQKQMKKLLILNQLT